MLRPLRILPSLLAATTIATVLGSCGEGSGDGPTAATDRRALLPDGGEVPARKIEDLEAASRAA